MDNLWSADPFDPVFFFLKKTNFAELDDNDEIDLTCSESCTEVLNQREKELSVEASFQEMWHADNFFL